MQRTGRDQKPRGEAIRPRRSLVFALVIVSALWCSLWNNTHYRSNGLRSPLPGVVTFALPIVRPVVSLDFAATVLNITSDQARRLIDDGSLLFAWDLSRKQNRPLVRIWAQSLAHYADQKPAPQALPDMQTITGLMFPNHGSKIIAHEVSRRWGCDPEHVTNLLQDGLLRKANGTAWRSGRGGSPAVDFASLVEFLEERQIC